MTDTPAPARPPFRRAGATTPSSRRASSLERLRREVFDVVVIGGGITGAGVALDAASRGLRTALVDKGDWAAGTSSKSSKLIHGGLRYLQQKEFGLVHEALRERRRLLESVPHLVSPLAFLVPLFGSGGVASSTVVRAYGTALWLYDAAGGWRIGRLHRRVSAAETLRHMGGLAATRVVGGFVYHDAQADDARLTLAVVRTAMDHGAVAVNHCGVTALLKDGRGLLDGVVLHDGSHVRTRCVVNATGVWTQDVLELDGEVRHRLRPAKGVHITVPSAKVRADMAVVVPVPKDRRSVFVVPAREAGRDRTYVGTTDTDYDGPLDDPRCTGADIDYLLGALNTWLAEPLTRNDVLGTWAGLRPLLAGGSDGRTADLSRRHAVARSRSGLVSVFGGKLTTYRRMAEDAVDEVVRVLGEDPRRRPCRTRRLALRGASGAADLRAEGAGARWATTDAVLHHLAGRHGGEALAVLDLVAADPALGRPLVEGLPYLAAEAVHAARHEQALTLEDVLARRTRALLYGRDAAAEAAPRVAALVGRELGWTDEERDRQVDAFLALVDAERTAERPVLR